MHQTSNSTTTPTLPHSTSWKTVDEESNCILDWTRAICNAGGCNSTSEDNMVIPFIGSHFFESGEMVNEQPSNQVWRHHRTFAFHACVGVFECFHEVLGATQYNHTIDLAKQRFISLVSLDNFCHTQLFPTNECRANQRAFILRAKSMSSTKHTTQEWQKFLNTSVNEVGW